MSATESIDICHSFVKHGENMSCKHSRLTNNELIIEAGKKINPARTSVYRQDFVSNSGLHKIVNFPIPHHRGIPFFIGHKRIITLFTAASVA